MSPSNSTVIAPSETSLQASIQQDNPTDPPLVTKVGLPYVGRLDVYKRGEANILFVLGELKRVQPNADYGHLTLVGHSNGGDIAMFCASQSHSRFGKIRDVMPPGLKRFL